MSYYTIIGISAVGRQTSLSGLNSHEEMVNGLKSLKRINDMYVVGTIDRFDEVVIVKSSPKASSEIRQSNGTTIEDMILLYEKKGRL